MKILDRIAKKREFLMNLDQDTIESIEINRSYPLSMEREFSPKPSKSDFGTPFYLNYTTAALQPWMITTNDLLGIPNDKITEIKDYAEALNYVNTYKNRPLKELRLTFILREINQLVLNSQPSHMSGGKFRVRNVNLENINIDIPSSLEIEPELSKILNKLLNSEDSLTIAVQTHIKLIKLQPFEDANKSSALLFLNLIMKFAK